MKLILDEWVVREVIDTLYMALTTLFGITGLDSPKEVAEKSANETAITRRISKAIDIIQQSEQPEVDLSEETITKEFHIINNRCFNEGIEGWRKEKLIARHFYELGLKARKED